MEHLVLVRADEAGQYLAQSVSVPQLHATAATADEAVRLVRGMLTAWLADARLVRIEVPAPESPWLKVAGMFADDPQYDEFLAEVEKARQADPGL